MPISSVGSWLSTLDAFAAHWNQVNIALGATPLALRGGYVLATLQTDRANLATSFATVAAADNARQIASADRDLKRANLKERLRQFRATVQGQIPNTVFPAALARLPMLNVGDNAWFSALDDAANLWTTINAATISGFTGPLKLVGNYLLANFTGDVASYKTASVSLNNATLNARVARQTRNDLFDPIRARLLEYRQSVQGAFPAGHALIESLPAYSPPPGSTPAPVNLSGIWNTATEEALLSWTASTRPDLKHYAVRYHPGPRYKADEEQSVQIVPKTETTLTTTFGLGVSGTFGFFKVYVVTETDNERGSNSVKITRP